MLESDITKLGLSDKEAKVYLASLELGPSPVQIISQKAKVNRATTYVVIDSLMNMGLMSTFEDGKKTYFTAEPPERLLDYLENQENRVQEKIKILKERLPELKSIFNIEEKPKIKYFEGIEGLRTVQMDFVNTLNSGDIIYTFLPLDDYIKTNLKEKAADISKKRLAKKIRSLVIYTSKNGRQIEYEKSGEIKLKEYLYIDNNQRFPISAGINIYGDKVFIIDYAGKTGGIVIENKSLAGSLKFFFNVIWSSSKGNSAS